MKSTALHFFGACCQHERLHEPYKPQDQLMLRSVKFDYSVLVVMTVSKAIPNSFHFVKFRRKKIRTFATLKEQSYQIRNPLRTVTINIASYRDLFHSKGLSSKIVLINLPYALELLVTSILFLIDFDKFQCSKSKYKYFRSYAIFTGAGLTSRNSGTAIYSIIL